MSTLIFVIGVFFERNPKPSLFPYALYRVNLFALYRKTAEKNVTLRAYLWG